MTLRVATLSFWHVHAGDYSRDTQNHPGAELIAVWDDDRERGQAGATEFGVEYTDDLDALLARDDLDAVIVTTETVRHRDIMLKAAAAGKHIFTEKLLAPTVAECEEIIAACVANTVTLQVSLPRLYDNYTQAITQTIAAGTLGELNYARVRLAHAGSTFGWLPERFYDKAATVGGALTDLGCHPVYLTQLFLGARPARVTAAYGHTEGHEVEDNAVVTAEYANGAIGVIEAGFVSPACPFTIEVFGDKGALFYGFNGEKIMVDAGQGPAEIAMPARLDTAYQQWVAHIAAGTTPTENLERAVELTRLVVAANEAAANGRAVSV